MKKLMIDLETYGTRAGCSLVSIGAVFFDEQTGQLGHELYTVVNRQSCREHGLFEDEGTIAWWSKQSAAARVAFDQSTEGEGADLPVALQELSEFVKLESGVLVYGNGNDFDKPILTAAYAAAQLKEPWAPFNGRCHRTLKSMFKVKAAAAKKGVAHNALDDAKNQAEQLMAICKQHRLVLA